VGCSLQLHPTQVGHWAACEAIQEPDIQRSWAPTALRPRRSLSRSSLLIQSGRSIRRVILTPIVRGYRTPGLPPLRVESGHSAQNGALVGDLCLPENDRLSEMRIIGATVLTSLTGEWSGERSGSQHGQVSVQHLANTPAKSDKTRKTWSMDDMTGGFGSFGTAKSPDGG
jgi:hypothetical protein